MSERIINNSNLLFNISFSAEYSFFVNETVICHNYRYGSKEKPYLIYEVHTTSGLGVMVNVLLAMFPTKKKVYAFVTRYD